ncbi:MAG: 50S ribosomal protein L31e [Methanoculleaceae archaeon]
MVKQLEEMLFVIPLRDVRDAPRHRRGKRAMREIRAFLARHMKSEDVKLDQSINEYVWRRGIQKPPRKIRVRAMKFEDGQVQAELAGE